MSGTGLTHVRYEHSCGPTLVAVRCPRCDAQAKASLPLHAAGVALVGDLSPEYGGQEWVVSCSECPLRAGPFYYDEMRAFAPLWFDLRGQGEDFWAWNAEHLEMLVLIFESADVTKHSHGWLATYVPGDWKRRASHYAKVAKRLLA
jgi:hypothetical protein